MQKVSPWSEGFKGFRQNFLGMENLREWRERFQQTYRIEAELQRKQPLSEKVSRFLEMRRLWGARLRMTDSNYRREKLGYLADLQERLRKVGEFRLGRATSDSESSASSA